MPRLLFLVGIVVAVFYIFSLVDCAMADSARIRALPKQLWIVLIVLFPLLGGILWFVIGRPQAGGGPVRGVPRKAAPDDDPEFLAKLRREYEQEQRLRRLEEKLADPDENQSDGNKDA